MCDCQKTAAQNTHALVPNFAAAGAGAGGGDADFLARAHASLPDVKYLALQACVGVSTNPGGQVCFNIPIYGNVCVTLPIPIPPGASLQACIQTCTKWGIPTGVQATIYLNGNSVYSTSWGIC